MITPPHSSRPLRSRALLCTLVASLLLAGTACRHDDTPTTKPSTLPGAGTGTNLPLVAHLVITPTRARLPQDETSPARPATFRLTFVVSNVTSRNYQGDAPDAAIARFALTTSADGSPIWSDPASAAQVVTPVEIPPGSTRTYNAIVTIPDLRPYAGQTLTFHASFTAAALKAEQSIKVE